MQRTNTFNSSKSDKCKSNNQEIGAVPSELVMESNLKKEGLFRAVPSELASNVKIGEKFEKPGNNLSPLTTTPLQN